MHLLSLAPTVGFSALLSALSQRAGAQEYGTATRPDVAAYHDHTFPSDAPPINGTETWKVRTANPVGNHPGQFIRFEITRP